MKPKRKRGRRDNSAEIARYNVVQEFIRDSIAERLARFIKQPNKKAVASDTKAGQADG